MDFAVDASHAYVVYAPYASADVRARVDAEPDVRLGIYDRSTGAEVAKLGLDGVWKGVGDVGPRPFVEAVSYRGGVVLSAVNGADRATFLAYIDRAGKVGARRLVEGFHASSLARHRRFVMAAGAEGVVRLFDQHLQPVHDWTTTDTLLLADATEDDLVVLAGARVPATGLYAGSLRWLTLRNGLEERASMPIPVDFGIHPRPKLLLWPSRAALVFMDLEGWKECRLGLPGGEFRCGEPAWGRDLAELHGLALTRHRPQDMHLRPDAPRHQAEFGRAPLSPGTSP